MSRPPTISSVGAAHRVRARRPRGRAGRRATRPRRPRSGRVRGGHERRGRARCSRRRARGAGPPRRGSRHAQSSACDEPFGEELDVEAQVAACARRRAPPPRSAGRRAACRGRRRRARAPRSGCAGCAGRCRCRGRRARARALRRARDRSPSRRTPSDGMRTDSETGGGKGRAIGGSRGQFPTMPRRRRRSGQFRPHPRIRAPLTPSGAVFARGSARGRRACRGSVAPHRRRGRRHLVADRVGAQ